MTKCHLLGRHGLASRAVFQQSDDPSNSTPCTRSVIHSSLSCTMTTPLDRLRLLPSYCGFCTAVDFAPTDHHLWILRCCDRGRSVTLWHLIPKKQIPATFQLHASNASQLSVCYYELGLCPPIPRLHVCGCVAVCVCVCVLLCVCSCVCVAVCV